MPPRAAAALHVGPSAALTPARPPAALPSYLPPQNFYYEHPAVTARSEEETRRYREMRDIHVTGEGVPKPVTTFEEASFPGGCRAAAAQDG